MGNQNVFRLSILISIFVSFFILSTCGESKAVESEDKYVAKCLEGKHHKKTPGPEDNLHKQCAPWANRSCCTEDTTFRAHNQNMYNFDWDHCKARTNKPMSAQCRKHFTQDLCFYECSPNTGPWLVKVEQKIRKEKFVDVPLCATDCDAWFEACKEDYTCTSNWDVNFNWEKSTNASIKGNVNKCPKDSTCETFQNVFRTAEFFCENIWNRSWKYTQNDQPCMRLWFDAKNGNPNDEVARLKFEQNDGTSVNGKAGSLLLAVITAILALFIQG